MTPVLSRPGYLTVIAVSTVVVDAPGRDYELQGIPIVFDSEDGEIVALNNGAIGFDTEYFDGVVLGENLRVHQVAARRFDNDGTLRCVLCQGSGEPYIEMDVGTIRWRSE